MLTLSPNEAALLHRLIRSTVIHALASGGALRRPPKSEDEAVLAVFSALAVRKRRWNRILARHGVKVALQGAFVHGTPHVKFMTAAGAPARCELGDLLLVVDDERPGHRSRQARITQAKLATRGRIVLTTPGELNQLDLNTRWPPFNFVPKSYPTAKTFDFRDHRSPGHVLDSSAYGGVDIGARIWEQIPPSAAMALGGGWSLACEVVGMVQGIEGRPAVLPARGATCPDDWSEVVRLLLEQSLRRITSARLGRIDRAWSYFALDPDASGVPGFEVLIDPARLSGGEPPIEADRPADDDGEGPMSFLRITISSLEDGSPRD